MIFIAGGGDGKSLKLKFCSRNEVLRFSLIIALDSASSSAWHDRIGGCDHTVFNPPTGHDKTQWNGQKKVHRKLRHGLSTPEPHAYTASQYLRSFFEIHSRYPDCWTSNEIFIINLPDPTHKLLTTGMSQRKVLLTNQKGFSHRCAVRDALG